MPLNNAGLRFTFKDLGKDLYVGSSALAYSQGDQVYVRAIRYNATSNRFLNVDRHNPTANKWENIISLSQKAGDWDYNIGDCGIAVGGDGSIMLTTNAGDNDGDGQTSEAWLIIPPHISGLKPYNAGTVTYHTTVDQFARDQFSAWNVAATNSVEKAKKAEEAANAMTTLVKKEVENRVKALSVDAAKVESIVRNLLYDTQGKLRTSGFMLDAVWTKGREAAWSMLKEAGVIK